MAPAPKRQAISNMIAQARGQGFGRSNLERMPQIRPDQPGDKPGQMKSFPARGNDPRIVPDRPGQKPPVFRPTPGNQMRSVPGNRPNVQQFQAGAGNNNYSTQFNNRLKK